MGPCTDIPFTVHFSPILSRSKLDSSRRVVVNLSAPEGNSVNNVIEKNIYDSITFDLQYLIVQNIVNAIESLDSDVLLRSKIDIKHVFRNLHVDPADYDLLGLKWRLPI